MGWLSKRRGVISVFLLIIFMVTFVFTGALVDAGRYRIAQTYAEAALDSATTSILSHYNKLMYDLYGVFAVDMDAKDKDAMEAEIKTLYKTYVDEMLGIAELDTSEYGTILSEVVEKLFDDSESDSDEILHNLSLNGLYDFSGTDSMKAGSTVTLADYTYVENQIIEHMKYRAPVSMIQSASGFVGMIQTIGEMGETITAVKEKVAITKEYKEMQTSIAEAPGDAAAFAAKVKTFLDTYTEANMLNAADAFDKVFTEAATDYKTKLAAADKKYLDDLKDDTITAIETNFLTLINEVADLKNDISTAESWIKFYNDEIEDLKKKIAEEEEKEKPSASRITSYNNEIADYEDAVTMREKEKSDLEEELASKETTLAPVLSDIATVESRYQSGIVSGDVSGLVNKAWEVNSNSKYGNVDIYELNRIREQSWNNAAEDYKSDVAGAVGKASGYFNAMKTSAAALVTEAETLLTQLQKNLNDSEQYIGKLKDLGNRSDNVSQICNVDVQTAKSSAGATVEIIPYVERMRSCLACFSEGIQGDSGDVDLAAWVAERETSIIEEVQTNFSKNPPELGTKLSLKSELQNNTAFKNLNIVQKAALKETTEFQKDYTTTESEGSTKTKAEKITDQDVSSDDMKKKVAEDVKKKDAGGAEIEIDTLLITENPGLLDINFVHTEASEYEEPEASGDISGKVSIDVVDRLLSALDTLVNSISGLLETGRDNIYINTYILETFPNYYTHYKKADDNKDNKLLSDPYKNYNASLAEVEFIITGAGVDKDKSFASLAEDPEGFDAVIAEIKSWFGIDPEDPVGIGELSAKSIKTRLYGLRLLFNTVSIFLDPTMYAQANTLSAWAGPFAPAVAVVVMIAWVLAETAIDVQVLTAGDLFGIKLEKDEGKVPLLKLRADEWHISVKGALEAMAETIANSVIDEVVKGLSEGVDQVAEAVRGQADALMYDVYTQCKDGTNETFDSILNSNAVQDSKDALLQWGDDFTNNVTTLAEEKGLDVTTEAEKINTEIDAVINNATDHATEVVNKELESARTTINKYMDDTYTTVNTKVLEQYDKVSDKITTAAKDAVEAGGDELKNLLNNNKDKYLPSGVTEGNVDSRFTITMGYTDYLQFFLFIMNGEVKMKRVMALMQANLTNQRNLNYKTGEKDSVDKVLLEYYPASVWADMELDIKYMFMTDQLVPAAWKENGRMKFNVYSSQGY